ncbi:MAG: hypothetical protein M3Y56_07665 [Armatimonadota bacterium]|nr:hypothetical protein [Armatimonadota bacterium]
MRRSPTRFTGFRVDSTVIHGRASFVATMLRLPCNCILAVAWRQPRPLHRATHDTQAPKDEPRRHGDTEGARGKAATLQWEEESLRTHQPVIPSEENLRT